MNPPFDENPTAGGATPSLENGSYTDFPSNWREAIPALISSRISLIQIEGKEAARSGIKSVIFVVIAVLCGFFAWATLLAGLIAFGAEAFDWPWSFVAIFAGLLHLLIGLILLRLVQSRKVPTFPITRAEFQKDREWLHQLNNKK